MPKDLKQIDKAEASSDVFTQKEWNTVWNFIRANPELAKTDSTIKQAIKDYEISIFLKRDEEQNIEYLLYDLETFFTLHKRKTHILSEDRFNLLICKMVTMWKNRDLYKAYKLAVNCPNDDLCKSIIEEYENLLPKQISHSQSKIIQVIENKNLSSYDGRRSLFKSSQEKEFFDAIRDTYPQFIVYPN